MLGELTAQATDTSPAITTDNTVYNLALDCLETAGIDNLKRSISDKFTPLEQGVYNTIQTKLTENLHNRQAVQAVLRELGMQIHTARPRRTQRRTAIGVSSGNSPP